MSVLALDLGTDMGWALREGKSTFSGVNTFKPGRHEGAGMQFVRFRRWLDEIAIRDEMKTRSKPGTGLTAIYYEEVRRHKGTDAAQTYGGFWSHLVAWCQENSVPFLGVPVQTIKKFATGKGNADKQAVIDAVSERWHVTDSDDEADAIALLYYALETYEKEKP